MLARQSTHGYHRVLQGTTGYYSVPNRCKAGAYQPPNKPELELPVPALKAASPPPVEEVEMTAVAVAAPSASAEAEELVKKLRAFVSLLADRIRKVLGVP